MRNNQYTKQRGGGISFAVIGAQQEPNIFIDRLSPKRKRRKSKKEEIWMETKASGAVLFYMLFYRRRGTKKKWDAYYII
jgi:hypothetical protein